MKKFLMILFLSICSLALMGEATATTILPGPETPLQTILDDITVDGDSSVNVQTDQIKSDAVWRFSDTTLGSASIILELAGFANDNKFGIYDVNDTEKRVQLFSGTSGKGDKVGFTYDTYGDWSILVTEYGATPTTTDSGLIFSTPTFGFYLETPDDIFFSDNSTDDGADHMVTFKGEGDLVAFGPINPYTGKPLPRTWNDYIIAWEDLPQSAWDQDYNDMVIMVESVEPVPEPATMLLLGAGLIGLAGIGRKKFLKK